MSDCPYCGYDLGSPRFTITGTCPDDMETVHLSRSSTFTEEALSNSLCCSVTPSEGSFQIVHTGVYDSTYVVWGLSESGGALTIDSILTAAITDDPCLSGDTLITMHDGTQRRIDTLRKCDMVMSEGGAPTQITTTTRGRFSSYHTLYRFEDGTIIDEPHAHRFYNVDQGFWQKLQLWSIGDHALNQNGEAISLVSRERIDEESELFSIWTGSGTYYANGLLSGSAFCNKKLLADATAEQAVDMVLSADEKWLVQIMGLEGVLP